VSIIGKVRVVCPSCGVEHDTELVQSINTHHDAKFKERLLRGELNVLVCTCGKRTQLAAKLLYHDPDESYFCQIAPDGEIEAAIEAFKISGAVGTQRVVPSQNALVEKVMILEAGMKDWAVELMKVLLLGSLDDGNLNRVLLFHQRDQDRLQWILLGDDGAAHPMQSAAERYEALEEDDTLAPAPGEMQIDRAWAVNAVRAMVHAQN
jgi:hypothetical protein